MVDHVCMSEGKGRGKMCFCEERLCNNGPRILAFSLPIQYLLLLTLLKYLLNLSLN